MTETHKTHNDSQEYEYLFTEEEVLEREHEAWKAGWEACKHQTLGIKPLRTNPFPAPRL